MTTTLHHQDPEPAVFGAPGGDRAMACVDAPFADFAPAIRRQSPLRQAITAACRRPEPECLAPLVAAARVPGG